MQDLTITLVQGNMHWQQPAANRSYFEDMLSAIDQPTDLVVLPEMFSTGFTMESAALAEPMQGPTHLWMLAQATRHGFALAGSLIIKEQERYFNRFLLTTPEGDTYSYDKRHLFRMAGEHQYYAAGRQRIIITYKGWRIMPQVCYDLRFPVWSRNRFAGEQAEYDLLLYVANWPASRISAWDALLPARAVENLCYSAGVNRTGTDGNDIPYNGHTAVYGPKAETLAYQADTETVLTCRLSAGALQTYRNNFPAWMDADSFTIKEKNGQQ